MWYGVVYKSNFIVVCVYCIRTCRFARTPLTMPNWLNTMRTERRLRTFTTHRIIVGREFGAKFFVITLLCVYHHVFFLISISLARLCVYDLCIEKSQSVCDVDFVSTNQNRDIEFRPPDVYALKKTVSCLFISIYELQIKYQLLYSSINNGRYLITKTKTQNDTKQNTIDTICGRFHRRAKFGTKPLRWQNKQIMLIICSKNDHTLSVCDKRIPNKMKYNAIDYQSVR